MFNTVPQFEFDGTSLAIVYAGVQELITFLKKQDSKIRSRELKKVYQDCALLIRERTLQRTHGIFQ
jgi:hypothetical protein